MHKKQIARKALGVLLLLVVLYSALGAYAKWAAYEARKDAELLLADVRGLRPGKSTLGDAERLTRIHNRFLMKGTPSRQASVLNFDFWYDNRLLSRLGLAPRVVFSVRLQFYQGTLAVSMVGLESGPYPSLSHHGASLVEFSQASDQDHRGFSVSRTSLGVAVYLRPGATEVQIDQAYAFNLRCLDKFGGCHSNAEIFFGPWSAKESK